MARIFVRRGRNRRFFKIIDFKDKYGRRHQAGLGSVSELQGQRLQAIGGEKITDGEARGLVGAWKKGRTQELDSGKEAASQVLSLGGQQEGVEAFLEAHEELGRTFRTVLVLFRNDRVRALELTVVADQMDRIRATIRRLASGVEGEETDGEREWRLK